MPEDMEEAISVVESFPKGGAAAPVSARDLCCPLESSSMDVSFDFYRHMMTAKRRILSAKQLESKNESAPSKRSLNSAPRGPRRASHRNLQSELVGPDMSFLSRFHHASDGVESSSSGNL